MNKEEVFAEAVSTSKEYDRLCVKVDETANELARLVQAMNIAGSKAEWLFSLAESL